MCLWQDIGRRVISVRHNWCVCDKGYVDVWCLAYICLVTDTSIVYYRHYTPTYVLSETYQLCLTDITRLHMSCPRHIHCVLQILHTYIFLVTDTSIVSYRHHTSTYVLSQTQQLCILDITHLHISCHRYISCVLQTSHVYIYLITDTTIVSYIHYTSTYVFSQTHQLCLTDITPQLMCLWQDICRRVMCVRYNWCVSDKIYVDVWCL
jgi:hypothetical protein